MAMEQLRGLRGLLFHHCSAASSSLGDHPVALLSGRDYASALGAEQGSPAAALLFCAGCSAFALGSFYSLTVAHRAVDAIFSFFGYLLAMAVAFFALGADYIGAILFVVYLGAILIFFMFVVFTLEPRWFSSGFALGAGQRFLPWFQGGTALLYFALLLAPLLPLLFLGGAPGQHLWLATAGQRLQRPGLHSFGHSLYGDYLWLTTLLGVLLLLALVLCMQLLVSGRSGRPFFGRHFVLFQSSRR